MDKKSQEQTAVQQQSAIQAARQADLDAKNNHPVEAENNYQKAIGQSDAPAYYVKLGQLLLSQAQTYESDSHFDEAADMYSQAEQQFSLAAGKETDPDPTSSDQTQAVQAAVSAGNIAVQHPTLAAEPIKQARIAVESAIPLATGQERDQLSSIRDQLRNR
jgi:hypothetical protein